MLDTAGFFVTDNQKAKTALSKCEQDAWRIFRLPTGIVSSDDFFNAIHRLVPLDPKIRANGNWDALEDALWEGLYSLVIETKIAILWPSASLMKESAPADFMIASEILRELTATLSDEQFTVGKPKQVLVLQVL